MKKKPSIKSLRNKADRLLQELGRKLYDKCEICGEPMDCLHHFFTKASSSALRYVLLNCIPICTSCHVKIELRKAHELTAIIVLKRGESWLKDLQKKQRCYTKTDRYFYENVIKSLTLALNEATMKPYRPIC